MKLMSALALSLACIGLWRMAPAQTSDARMQVTGGELERFVLELPSQDGGRPQSVGWMTLFRRREGQHLRLEQELHFSEGDLSVWHVEDHSQASRELVWRESGNNALRTWIARLSPATGQIRVESWGLGEPNFRTLKSRRRAELPLEWLERARVQRAGSGRRRMLSPLAARVETVLVEVGDPRTYSLANSASDPEAGRIRGPRTEAKFPPLWRAWISADPRRAWRHYRIERLDGSQVGQWLFRGRRLYGVEWQAGGLRARRVEAHEVGGVFESGSSRPGREPSKMQHLQDWLDLERRPRDASISRKADDKGE